MQNTIPEIKIKQTAFIVVIVGLLFLIIFNLKLFIPSFLGAVTLYIISRKYNFYLQEKRKWKPWVASMVIMLATLVVLVLPIYFTVDMLIAKLGNANAYMEKFNTFLEKIQTFIYQKTNFDILSKDNLNKVKNSAATLSSTALSSTFNTLTVVVSMYFILYFMLEKPRLFERLLSSAAPLKRNNVTLIGEKMRKLVIANAIGIPVVALGQGIVAVIGYLIFGAPSPWLLFALTALSSMLPIVGAAIVYVPVCIFMIAEGQVGPGLGLAAWCLIAVGLTDNLLRFTLLKRLEDIHPLNTVFGIITGMNIFGFMGLIYGPILVSLTILLLQIYRNEFADEDIPELEIPNSDQNSEGKNLIV